jgi:hypothetical protein
LHVDGRATARGGERATSRGRLGLEGSDGRQLSLWLLSALIHPRGREELIDSALRPAAGLPPRRRRARRRDRYAHHPAAVLPYARKEVTVARSALSVESPGQPAPLTAPPEVRGSCSGYEPSTRSGLNDTGARAFNAFRRS